MAEAVGAMGAILEENGDITNSAGIWKTTQEEWGYTLPPFSILMALQESDVNYTFLSRFKIDDLGQGNTFLVDLNMGGNNINNVNMVYVKEVEAETMKINNLSVLETINIPNAEFASITVETMTEDAFKIHGKLESKNIETKQLEITNGETDTLEFTRGEINLTMTGIEDPDDSIKLKVDNDFTFISSQCKINTEEDSCEHDEANCCLDETGNIIMAPVNIDWDSSHPLKIENAVRGLNDKVDSMSATISANVILANKILFGEKIDGKYPYLLDLIGSQTYVNDVMLIPEGFDDNSLSGIFKEIYKDEFYQKYLLYLLNQIEGAGEGSGVAE